MSKLQTNVRLALGQVVISVAFAYLMFKAGLRYLCETTVHDILNRRKR